MALTGVKSLVERLKELRARYSNYRLKLFTEAYPKYQINPKKIELGLRTELGYFLNNVDELLREMESRNEPIPNATDPIESFKTLLSTWEVNIAKPKPKAKLEPEVEISDEDLDREMLFELEM